MGEHPFSQFKGVSPHRCKCLGENDSRDGTWRACPPDLCEADVLLRRMAELEIDRNDWKRISDEAEARAEAAEAKLARAEQEIAYTHDRGDHLVYIHEWEEFDRWQRWADDQRKDAEKYQPTAQEWNDAMEGR